MKLNNIIEGSNSEKNRDLLLHCMREMLLTEKYAPMNVDLFYDQFFNKENCSNDVNYQIEKCKEQWVNIADHFTVYLDNGVDSKIKEKVMNVEKNHENNFVDYQVLNSSDELKKSMSKINSINEALDFYILVKGKIPLDENRIDSILKNNILPDHLPLHFDTFLNYYKSITTFNSSPKRVIFESPFAGDMQENVQYAARAIVDLILNHNKAPMASHLLYTRMLNDLSEKEREIGIDAGLAYGRHAEETIISIDRGLSTGMKYGVLNAIKANRPFKCFTLSNDPNIIREVSELDSLEKIETWIEKQKKLNSKLFEKFGDITPYKENSTLKSLKVKK